MKIGPSGGHCGGGRGGHSSRRKHLPAGVSAPRHRDATGHRSWGWPSSCFQRKASPYLPGTRPRVCHDRNTSARHAPSDRQIVHHHGAEGRTDAPRRLAEGASEGQQLTNCAELGPRATTRREERHCPGRQSHADDAGDAVRSSDRGDACPGRSNRPASGCLPGR